MRKFIVNVNGSSYEVEVEEISGSAASAPVAAPAPAAAPAPKAAPAAPKPVKATASQETVNSPMPGTILDVKVKAGDAVKSGATLLILEAMKMENEILAPKDGVVVAVNVAKGSTVNSGDALCIIG